MDTSYVWQLSLFMLPGEYDTDGSSAGVRATFQSPYTFLFISRKTVFNAFVQYQEDYIKDNVNSVLCAERPDHKPLLPKVKVSSELFDRCKSLVPLRTPTCLNQTAYATLIPFQDILLAPVEYDHAHKLMYMVRVIRKTAYDASPVKPKYCVVTMPVTLSCNNVEYVFTEEACFFAVGSVASMQSIALVTSASSSDQLAVDGKKRKRNNQ
jgi:hypothetical protein